MHSFRERQPTTHYASLKDIEGVALHVTNLIRIAFYMSPGQCEAEYEGRNGQFCIPRAIPANYLNDRPSLKDVTRKPQGQSFGCEARALQLNISSPGLLDTMNYTGDLERTQPLARDEMKIKFKAVRIGFMDILMTLSRLSGGGLDHEYAGTVNNTRRLEYRYRSWRSSLCRSLRNV